MRAHGVLCSSCSKCTGGREDCSVRRRCGGWALGHRGRACMAAVKRGLHLRLTAGAGTRNTPAREKIRLYLSYIYNTAMPCAPGMLQSLSARVSVHIVDRAATTHAVADAPHGTRARARVVRASCFVAAVCVGCSAARFSRDSAARAAGFRRPSRALWPLLTVTVDARPTTAPHIESYRINQKRLDAAMAEMVGESRWSFC